jgi:poly(3-hydroxybutyrate) depolymerase
MELHNRADTVVDFGGVPETVRFWRLFNGCPARPSRTAQGDILKRTEYAGVDGAPVVVLEFDDGSDGFGHHWPRPKYYGFEAYEPIWDFLRRHSLDGSSG